MRATSALFALLCLGSCTVDERQKPEPPDMTPLVEAYANPTRNFDEPTAAELQALVEAKVHALFDLDRLADRLETTLAAINDDPSAPAGRMPIDFAGDGYARIERICTGYGDPAPPVDRDANGYLDLTLGFTDGGIDPVIWGRAVSCEEQIDTKRLQVAGNVNLYIGNVLQLGDLPVVPVLFQLTGFAFSINDVELVTGGFDFQVCRGTVSHCKSGFVELLLGLPSGGTLVFFVDPATKSGGFRSANGIWTCSFSNGQCHDEQGTVVTTPVYQL